MSELIRPIPETIIRPHHALMVASIIRDGYTVEGLAEDAQSNAYAQAATFGPNNPRSKDYVDRYGETPQQAGEFNADMSRFLKMFVELPDDAPVKASPEPDDICKGCFIGNHCDQAVGTDAAYTRAIRATARVLDLSELVTESQEQVQYRTGEPFIATVQRMNAGTARQILAEPHFEYRTARTRFGAATSIGLRKAEAAMGPLIAKTQPKR